MEDASHLSNADRRTSLTGRHNNLLVGIDADNDFDRSWWYGNGVWKCYDRNVGRPNPSACRGELMIGLELGTAGRRGAEPGEYLSRIDLRLASRLGNSGDSLLSEGRHAEAENVFRSAMTILTARGRGREAAVAESGLGVALMGWGSTRRPITICSGVSSLCTKRSPWRLLARPGPSSESSGCMNPRIVPYGLGIIEPCSRIDDPQRRASPRDHIGSSVARLLLVCGACLLSVSSLSAIVEDTDAWERELRRRGVDPTEVPNPLAVSDEMRDVARATVGSGTEMERLQRLHRFLFDQEGFPFDYKSTGTYSAIDAFRLRRGNCVSFTMLFIALARGAGLSVRAALPKVTPTVEKTGDLVVVSDHIVAIHELPDGAAVFDFFRPRDDPLVGLRFVDDMWITAIYLNNLGAEALLAGQLQTATHRLEHAVALAPDFAPSFGNLGLVRRRLGDIDGAFGAYRQSLAIDPGSPTVLTNLSSLYLMLGREAEARTALAAADHSGQTPYTLLVRGDFEMRDGKIRRALRLYRCAARTGPRLADPYLAIARAQMARGRARAARSALTTALMLEPDHAEARRELARLDGAE